MLNVVIVEDSSLITKVLAMLIERNGGKVVGQAISAAEAMTIVRERRPDVVTMDLNLVGGGSLDLIGQFVDLEVPVVVVSAATYVGSPATAEALREGANACVDKARIGEGDLLWRALTGAAARPWQSRRLAG
jgi:two-component system chemotaxis response regulator CheB